MKPAEKTLEPYIGITDFMTRKQTLAMLSFFEELPRGSIPHRLMVGVMMSYKTLNNLPNKWTKAFPKTEEVKDIFVEHPLLLNTLHYADYTNSDVVISIAKAIHYGGPNLDAIQLDMIWPSAQNIKKAFEIYVDSKRVPVILQIGKNAIEEADGRIAVALSHLMSYAGVVDGVLLDMSMGQGKPMDQNILLPYVEAIYKYIPGMKVAVAGGLGPNTIHLVERIISRFPDISIDAQGQLRPSGSALDPIDWEFAKKYTNDAVTLYSKQRN